MPPNTKYNFSSQMTGEAAAARHSLAAASDPWWLVTWSQSCFLTLPGRKEIKMQKRTKKRFWLLWSLPKNLALMQARTMQTRRWLRGSPVVIVISEAIVSQNHELPHYPRCPVPGRDNQSSGHQQQPYTCHNNTNYHASHNFSTLHSGKTGTPQHHRRIDS